MYEDGAIYLVRLSEGEFPVLAQFGRVSRTYTIEEGFFFPFGDVGHLPSELDVIARVEYNLRPI